MVQRTTTGPPQGALLVVVALGLATVAAWATSSLDFRPKPRNTREDCAALWAQARDLLAVQETKARLRPGAPLYFAFEALAGTGLEITAVQDGVDLSLELLDGRCRPLAATDELLPLNAAERLIALSQRSERLLLEVAAISDSPEGEFALSLKEYGTEDPLLAQLRQQREQERWLVKRISWLRRSEAGGTAERSVELLTAELRRLHELACRVGRCAKAVEAAFEVGQDLLRQRRPEQAEMVFTTTLELSSQGENTLGAAKALHELGLLAASRNRVEEQLERYRTALAAAEKALDPREQALILSDAGVALRRAGRYVEARNSFRRSLQLAAMHRNVDRECLAANGLGIVEQALGHEVEAEGLYLKAAAACDSASRRFEAIRARCMLSDARISRGDFVGARAALEEALAASGELGDWASRGLVAFYRGRLALRTFDLETAALDYREAQKSFASTPVVQRRRDLPQLETPLDLAWTEFLDGDPVAALATLRRAEKEVARHSDDRLEANLNLMMGVVQRHLGNARDSVEHLERALALAARAGLVSFQIESRSEVGESFRSLGQLDLAERHLETALRSSRGENDLALLPGVLARLSLVYRDRGHLEQAQSTLEGALAGFESYRGKLQDPDSKISYFAARRRFYQDYVDVLVRLAEQGGRRKFEAEAFRASERSRARGLLDLLAESAIEVRSDLPVELAVEEQRLEAEVSSLGREIIVLRRQPRPDRDQLEALESRLALTEIHRKQLERRIRGSDPRYAAIKYPEPFGLEAVQSLLKKRPGHVLLEYSLGEDRATLFLVTAQTLHSLTLGSPADLRAAVAKLRDSQLADGEVTSEATSLASWETFQAVLAPAMPHLERLRPQHLIVVPDDEMVYLPFETLLTERPSAGSPPRYLVERWPISYVPSATVLGQLEAQQDLGHEQPSRPEWVAVGAPDYREIRTGPATTEKPAATRGRDQRERRLMLPKLLGAEREVASIQELFSHAEASTLTLLGQEANERNVKNLEALAQSRRVHFAVHAFTDDRDPAHYGLILSLNQPGEDGVLRVAEIFRLRLNAELVVLSACSSGLGQRVRGEGLVGLAQAFFYAGAETLVVSLWQVDDQVTADLMRLFYVGLLAGANPAAALRQAKLMMLSARPNLAPRLWAPFIVVGDTR